LEVKKVGKQLFIPALSYINYYKTRDLVPPEQAGDREVRALGGETQRNALLLCLLFLTPPRERKLVKSSEPKRAELIFTLDSSDYRRSQQLLAAVSGRNLDQALQPTQKRTASCVQLYIAVQKFDLLGRNRSL
jgi:hypothetical protein